MRRKLECMSQGLKISIVTLAAQHCARRIVAGSLKLPSVCSATTDAGHSGVGSSTFMRTPIFACAEVFICPLLLVRLYSYIFPTPAQSC